MMLKKLRKKKRLLVGIALSTVIGSAGVYAAQDGAFGSSVSL